MIYFKWISTDDHFCENMFQILVLGETKQLLLTDDGTVYQVEIDQHIRFPLLVSNKPYKKYYVKEEKCTLMLTCVHFKNVVPIINCMNLYKNHKRFEWKHLLFYLINKAKSARIFIKELIIRLLYCGNVNVLCQW